MTLIAAVGFPEEVIILSDSRASYIDGTAPKNELKKIYQLSSTTCLAYTTEDVKFTWKLIEEITKYAFTLKRIKTGKFLGQITLYAKQTYSDLTRESKSKPKIILIYAGMDERPYKINKKLFIQLKHSFKKNEYIPEKVLKARILNNQVIIVPPTPILIKQKFPDGECSCTRGWDYTAEGAGKKFEEEVEKFYKKLFHFPCTFNKAIILKEICDRFINTSNNPYIGGLAQTFTINEKGVSPLMFIENSNNIERKRYYIDINGDWVEENNNGTKIKITQNPSL